jgi:hypothetical protein
MASATGIPERVGHRGEEEPLLGRPGDVRQEDEKPFLFNVWIGTGSIAQAGIWVLAAIVWGAIFSHKLIFFSAHPLLNSAGLLLLTQGALVLQPTHTPEQKRIGTLYHLGFNSVGTSALTAGLIVIELNKAGHPGSHFKSVHAILGIITYVFLFLQALVGFTQYFAPQLYGSVENAKSVYKYHRASGYVIMTMALATVCAATQTDYSKGFLGIQLWATIVASVLVLTGVLPRVKLQKLGLK